MIAVSFIPEFTLLGSILANDDMSNRLSTFQSLTSSQFNLIYNAFSFAIADVLAKPIFGLYVFAIAVAKTKFDREAGNDNTVAHDAPELDLVPNPSKS